MRHIRRDSGGGSVVASTLLILTCLVLGLLAGGMLVIGVALVSFWKRLSPSDFQAWFASYAHLVGRLMIPLGVGAIAVTVAAVAACWRGSATARRWLLVAAVAAIGVMVTYPLFFEATNAALVRGGLSDSAARSLLDRWATWHWIRTGLGMFGFVAALCALHGGAGNRVPPA
jgi:anthrone oxygenase-like protein